MFGLITKQADSTSLAEKQHEFESHIRDNIFKLSLEEVTFRVTKHMTEDVNALRLLLNYPITQEECMSQNQRLFRFSGTKHVLLHFRMYKAYIYVLDNPATVKFVTARSSLKALNRNLAQIQKRLARNPALTASPRLPGTSHTNVKCTHENLPPSIAFAAFAHIISKVLSNESIAVIEETANQY
jgi:maltooligosyltrehalose synthase